MQHSLNFKDDEKPGSKPAHSAQIPYDFPADPKTFNGIALIGEAPGAEEVRLGHPFVGRSGQLLNKILEQAGIHRRDCFVGNVFRSQPPGNKVDHFFISRRASVAENIPFAEEFGQFGSAWTRADFAADIHHLANTLKKLKPKIIVSLGRTPLWALTGEGELMKKVGKPLPCRLLPGVKVIPTFHPSFILRGNWKLQDEWLSHLLAAKKFSA